MAQAQLIPRRLSRVEYDRMAALDFFRGERVELIRGMVIKMSPIGPPHASVVDRLTRLLVLGIGERALVRIQQPFLAYDESEPEPDVAVVPESSYSERHPDAALLMIEVAETSLDYDRDIKGPLYAASGVQEYWIVDVASRAIEMFSEGDGTRFNRVRRIASGGIGPAAFPDVIIDIAQLFV
ncbi:MAG: Uma2 family endonuclease [Polyangiaceae bacterium]